MYICMNVGIALFGGWFSQKNKTHSLSTFWKGGILSPPSWVEVSEGKTWLTRVWVIFYKVRCLAELCTNKAHSLSSTNVLHFFMKNWKSSWSESSKSVTYLYSALSSTYCEYDLDKVGWELKFGKILVIDQSNINFDFFHSFSFSSQKCHVSVSCITHLIVGVTFWSKFYVGIEHFMFDEIVMAHFDSNGLLHV